MTGDGWDELNVTTIDVSLSAGLADARTRAERAQLMDAANALYARARSSTASPELIAAIDERMDALRRDLDEARADAEG
jgi:hypothetical protein